MKEYKRTVIAGLTRNPLISVKYLLTDIMRLRVKPAMTICLLLFSACGETLMQQEVNTSTPVVESYLEAGKNSISVKIYTMEVYLGEDYILSQPVSGLNLKINDRDLTETGNGVYTLALGEDTIREGQKYELQFEYREKEVKTSTIVPQTVNNLEINPPNMEQSASYGFWDTGSDTTQIILSWDNPDNGYYQIYVDASNTSSNFPDGNFRKRMMQPVQANSYTMSPREFRTVGNYSIYVYKVNKEYVELYERVSASDLANPVSFIENALGVFTAVSVARVEFTVYENEE
jgi:hypothetical protein